MSVHPGQVALRFIDGEPPDKNVGRNGGRRGYISEAQQLREQSGRWAVLRRDMPSPSAAAQLANHIRMASLAAFKPRGSFEAVARQVDDEYRVYVRHLPKEVP